MSSPEGIHFEDPKLKAALRRRLCSECAPGKLREKIAQCIAREMEGEAVASNGGGERTAGLRITGVPPGTIRLNPASPNPFSLSTLLPGFAIAAAMIFAVGYVAIVLNSSSQTVPQALEAAAITRHDLCCQAPDHHNPTLPQASFTQMGAQLRNELKHPVLAADMTKDSWAFNGVSICPMAGVPAAHLLFRDGQKTLSVFSLPASAFPTLAANQIYEATTADGHNIVARSQDGAIYCLVTHAVPGEINIDTLGRLLEGHKSEATVAWIPVTDTSLAAIPHEP